MRAFIAMPFAAEFDNHWAAIQQVCRQHKIDTFRVDKNLSFERHIDIAIRKEIEDSDFVIAVLTGESGTNIPNPNVAFEVGYAQGIKREAILLADSVDGLPFDFKQQRTCIYQSDMEKLSQNLDQELILLKKKLEENAKEQLKEFFRETSRCLNIVLPSQYRFYKESFGFHQDSIWHGFYFFKYKTSLLYAVCCAPKGIDLFAWLGNTELREKQKTFAKEHYDEIRRQLGFDSVLYFEEKEEINQMTWMSEKNFASERMKFESNELGTSEALAVALRLKAYIETFQPIFTEFAKKNQISEF